MLPQHFVATSTSSVPSADGTELVEVVCRKVQTKDGLAYSSPLAIFHRSPLLQLQEITGVAWCKCPHCELVSCEVKRRHLFLGHSLQSAMHLYSLESLPIDSSRPCHLNADHHHIMIITSSFNKILDSRNARKPFTYNSCWSFAGHRLNLLGALSLLHHHIIITSSFNKMT